MTEDASLSGAEFSALLQTLIEPMALLGPAGVEQAGPAWRQLCGLDPEQMLGMAPEDLLDPAPGPCAPGRRMAFLARLKITASVGPMVKGVCLGLEDGRQLWAVQGLASLMDLGLLTAGLIHNLAGPLSVIRSTTELLQRVLERDIMESPELAGVVEGWPPSVKNGFGNITNSIDMVSSAMRDLLAKMRGEASQSLAPQDINQIIERELRFVEDNLGLKQKIEQKVALDPELPPVKGLYSDFSQSLHNLLRNAVQAMDESPRKELEVSTALEDGMVTVRISDTGRGIAEHERQSIFEPFYSGSRSAAGGSGLGLHSVKQLLLPYGAKLTVQSRPGSTTFCLRLPLDREPDLA